ncbi:phage integrase SAM-like domain-containing protein, partial [Acidobacteriia bacterium AH_259_A11_L15]|nr:phage integrase SAM-like domain-containing protein [Acidobacteriia bacterium AH_259_A11_L15]
MGLRDWQKANEKAREWEAQGKIETEKPEPTTVKAACNSFESDAVARGLREPTLYKYRLLFRQLQDFARDNGLLYIADLDVDWLRRFRESWRHSNLSALKTLERLRAFFRFCQDGGWINQNPAQKLKNPRIIYAPTLPFTRDEMVKILAACDKYSKEYPKAGRAHAARLRALVLLLRYSGLRIRDAVTLERSKLTGDKLMLYTAKTGTPVYCPLPPAVVQALEAAPVCGQFFFWRGQSNPKSAVGDWQRTEIVRLGEGCGRARSPFPRHLCGRAPAGRRPARPRFRAARPSVNPHHGEALRALGALAPGAARGRRAANVGRRCEGYAGGTR